ncbi:uncharacterized protein Z519_00797 [Cladophialophora bantiana CBS 173.52]|uniref:Uncharacterized protein n=1 Tax=Cladophialophora bantiana (strain ATCC 10958 / CBS 173.52 / CDC B-1940 / NIH 8579) TaxID=1442370 RepID=A0A0D2IQY3_CLAB1|nr:uncharacterized protein Z519_00797 [Cladophialophora bantiana CBS 173.52]KIW99134.1 hypothetical protein Z519_00797 [Cladophialophora bantiana CBS 173.52]
MEPRPDHRFDPSSPEAANLPPLPDGVMDSVDWNDPESVLGTLMGGGSGTNLPIPKKASPEEVRWESTSRSHAIFQSFDTLHDILQRHEATIQNRWTKRTKQQRLKILLNAWPGLPASHRPDFEAFRIESPQQRQAGTRYRGAFMWPYLNQEDLSRPRTLLLLLNARGRNHPSCFAAADIEAMHLGRVTQGIVPIFLNTYTVILNGISDRRKDHEYGKLVSWEDDLDAFDWMHTRRQFIPGEALLILEAQERLMTFLVDCCMQILHDIPVGLLTSDSYPIQPEPPSKSENNVTGHASLAVMAAEAPYRLPSKLDLSRVSSLLSAITIAKEDHLWSLREDPGYFQQCLLDRSEHRLEMVADAQGKRNPILHPRHEDMFWSRVIVSAVSDCYIELEIFAALSRQAQHLRELQLKYESQITPEDDLPVEYLDAMLVFRYFLTQAAKEPIDSLKSEVAGSPAFRTLFFRLSPDNSNSSTAEIQLKGVKIGPVEEQLLWLFRILWEDDQQLFLLQMPLVVDELQRLLDSEPRAREMVTGRISDIIGDLAIICECLRQLDTYLPWALTFENQMVGKEKNIQKRYQLTLNPTSRMLAGFKERNENVTAQLGKPVGNRFDYPVWRRRNKENIEIMRRSEANLDAFWSYVDKKMGGRATDVTKTAVMNLLTSRTLQRTPEWTDPKALNKQSPKNDIESITKPLSEVYFELESRTSQTLSSTARRVPKEKIKTRGVPSTSTADHLAEPQANPFDPQPTFAVDSRAFKVFRTLFFVPSVSATPGEVGWNDFVHAMTSTGFAAEKLYGSVWHFTPTKLDVERSIQFHEPHPSGKIPFRVARRHGRRLYRAYGWHGSMFVLQEKTTAVHTPNATTAN